MSVPTTGWTARNGIVYNDYLVPDIIGALVPDNSSLI